MNLLNRVRFVFSRDKAGNWYNSTINKGKANYTDSTYLELAMDNPVLSTLINIRGDYLSRFKFYEKVGGERLEDTKAVELINNPNPFQTKEDFLKQHEWLRICYGWVFVAPYGGVGYTNFLYNLDSSSVDFPKELSRGVIYKKSDIKALNDYVIKYNDLNTDIDIKYKDVIPFYDTANGLGCSPFTAKSRIAGIFKQADNINKGSDAENIIIQTNGREIIYKEKGTDPMTNSMPMPKGDKEDAERKFGDYGLGSNKKRTLITNTNMGWKSLHIPHDELGFKNIIETNSNLIAQSLQVPNEIYQIWQSGSTYENQGTAEIKFYQNVMQPVANNIARSIGKRLGVELVASVDHLPVMQEIENIKADRMVKVSTALKNLTQSGLTVEQATQYLENNGINVINGEQ